MALIEDVSYDVDACGPNSSCTSVRPIPVIINDPRPQASILSQHRQAKKSDAQAAGEPVFRPPPPESFSSPMGHGPPVRNFNASSTRHLV